MSFTSVLLVCDVTLYVYKKPLFVFIFEFKLGSSSQNLISLAMDYINVAINCIGILVPPDIELLSVPYPVEAT